MNGHILVLGGARSGKTAFSEQLAAKMGQAPVYLATAEILDSEMRERVTAHQIQRDDGFITVEEPIDLAETIQACAQHHDVILVDCLTLWISNLLGAEIGVSEALDDLVDVLDILKDTSVIMVSNEVGLGIVPDNALARSFRDLAGSTHQRLADICTNVYFVAAGLPLAMKGALPTAGK